jgi:hypothetical protein
MAFKQIGSLATNSAPVLRKSIITNSVVSTVLDSVKTASGFLALGTTGALVLGHIMSHVRKDGVGLESTGVSGSASGSYVGTWTAASDNQTVGMVSALVDISKFTLYSVSLDAAAGTTTGSNLDGYNLDIATEKTLDESTATTGSAQYHGWGLDPNNTAQVIVNILESSVFGS